MVSKTEQTVNPKALEHPVTNGVAQPVHDDDPFRYGWRTVAETLPDGQIRYHDMPLTPEDYLDPQLGDSMVQSDPHLILVVSLYNRFKKKYHNDQRTGVFSDLKMLWGKAGIKEPAPDLAAVGAGGHAHTVDVEVEPMLYRWYFGDGTTAETPSLGQRYPAESDIQHVYEQSSLAAGGAYVVTVEVTFSARYRVNGGAWEALDPITRSFSNDYPVQQLQSVLVGQQP